MISFNEFLLINAILLTYVSLVTEIRFRFIGDLAWLNYAAIEGRRYIVEHAQHNTHTHVCIHMRAHTRTCSQRHIVHIQRNSCVKSAWSI